MRYYLFISNKWETGFSLIGGFENKSRKIILAHSKANDYEENGYYDDIFTYLDTEDNTLNRIN